MTATAADRSAEADAARDAGTVAGGTGAMAGTDAGAGTRPRPRRDADVTFIGVRHHSPACARLVARAIRALRPAYVLVEGPADMNGRLDELLLGHDLPVAVFSHYRDEERAATSWAPLCDYSPEWVALTEGRAAGAEVLFIDLPAWHPAFAERVNRFADAEARYTEATTRLCERFAADSVDALWDRLFEVADHTDAAGPAGAGGRGSAEETRAGAAEAAAGTAEAAAGAGAARFGAWSEMAGRLDAYFAVVRGDAEADEGDRAREAYMASWVRAAAERADGGPVLVVTGGFHQPALRALTGFSPEGQPQPTGDAGSGARAETGATSTTGAEPEPCAATEPGPDTRGVTGSGPAPRSRAGAGTAAAAAAGAGSRSGSETGSGAGETGTNTGSGRPGAGAGTETGSGSEGEPGAEGKSGPESGTRAAWPRVPEPPAGALAGSFLVPYSFRQLDAFAGYQSGMPSPGYYQRLWEEGPRAAADTLVREVAGRLRERRHPVSTAALIAARAQAEGLSLLRGHPVPARVDVLDGLAGALVADALDQPLPWTARGTLAPGSHPAIVEMVAVCCGDRTGRLHPATPAPPLVHDVAAELERLGLDGEQPAVLDLTTPRGLERSRALHRLRVLGVPGHERRSGPRHGTEAVFSERWERVPAPGRDAALVEAGAYGARLADAAVTALTERARRDGPDAGGLARTLFDAVLCGVGPLTEELLTVLAGRVRELPEPGALGEVLATSLGLWRHDRVYGVARGPLLAEVVDGAAVRLLWLLEGVHGPSSGVDTGRLAAVAALRDALLHAPRPLSLDRETAAGAAHRVAADRQAPADLRGAAFGLARALGTESQPAAAMAEFGPDVLGDWLAGLFAVSRDDIGDLVGVLDRTVGGMSESAFLAALPALRQAFAFFPPRERERIAGRLLDLRGVRGSARALLRTGGDPMALAAARALEDRVSTLLTRYGLGTPPRPQPGASPVPGPGTGTGTGRETGTEGPPPSAAGPEAGGEPGTAPAVVDGPTGVPDGPGSAAGGTRRTARHRAAKEPGPADGTGTVHRPRHGTGGGTPPRTAHGTEDDPKGIDR
ncbi:DUF5682 family protein [Streptomyces sp. S07_1.15]|uniref:DUF5682 family protein n=1 Tax=Streptomyces sp. S07_1.15 TaxID=2873925 RepID=UPI001D1521A5|nr:DUF5682 family protein [Streptomyces sp. S07_1.15]MCC3655186.1 DUF5682 family protein [Streptomyces sp. S07_1.15]